MALFVTQMLQAVVREKATFLMSFEYNEHRSIDRQDWFPWGSSFQPLARTSLASIALSAECFLSLHNLYIFPSWMLCFLLAHMPFPSSPFTKADTDDGFMTDFIYLHSCLLLFYCGLDWDFTLLRFYVTMWPVQAEARWMAFRTKAILAWLPFSLPSNLLLW